MMMRERNDKETPATRMHRTAQIRSCQDKKKKNSTKADASESKKEDKDRLSEK